MKPVCEIMVKRFLPVLRAMVAKELCEKYGMKQEESARKLGITQAAISYYLSGRRGVTTRRGLAHIEDDPKVKEMVRELARSIASGKASTPDAIGLVCRTCILLRSRGDLCPIHSDAVHSLGKGCNLCKNLFPK